MALSPIIINLAAQGAAGVITDLNAVADATDAIGESASGAAGQVDAATSKLQGMSATAGKVRDIGIALTATGVAGIALSNSLAAVAEEGNAVEARLESILKAQGRIGELDTQNNVIQDVTVRGHFADDDEIRNATVLLDSFSVSTAHMGELLEDAARQARTMGTDVSSVAQQLGTAYNSGNVGMLKKSGITVSEEDIQKIKDAYAESAQQGQQAFVDILGPAIRANTAALEDSLTATQAATNDAARALDDFQTNVGTGSANAQATLTELGGKIISVINLSPELEESAGVFLTYGSYALTAGGAALTLGGQVASMAIQWKLAKATQALASGGAAVAATTEAGAVAGAGAASAGAGAAAGVGSIGFGALALSIWAAVAPLLVFVAIALAAAAAMYGLDKAMHAAEDDALEKNIEAGNATNQQRLDNANADRKKKGLAPITVAQWQAMEDPNSDVTTPEDVAKPPAWKSGGEGDAGGAAGGGAVDMGALQKMVADAKSGGASAVQMPTVGGAAVPISGLPTAQGASFEVRNGQSGDVAAAQADVDELQAEIQALQDAKRKASKSKKDAIQEQIILKQRDLKRAKDELKAAKSGDKEAQKRADKAAKSGAEIDEIEAGAGFDAEIAGMQKQLEAAKEARDIKKVESLTYQIEMAKAAKDRDAAMIKAALVEDVAERGDAERVAKAHYEAARQSAQRASKDAGSDTLKSLMQTEDEGESRLQKIGLKGRAAEYIADLEDKLSEAKDAKDAVKIEALTLQIEMAKAEQSRQEALIDAANITDKAKKSYALSEIQAEFDNAASAARRSARRARRDADKSEKGGKDGKNLSDEAIRAQLAMMKMKPSFSVPALGSGIQYGDRFAEAEAMAPNYAATAMRPVDFGAAQFASDRRPAGQRKAQRAHQSAEFQVEAESYRQNGAGDIEIKLKGGVLKVPYMGLSAMDD